jgi:predicted ATPase/DNA-binding SARP family transcriptional activator
MEFRILGPLEVSDGERSIPLGGAKQRALLAVLLLHANEVVSTDRLIDDLWGEHPPETASTALQGYVSRLRKVLGAEALVTQAPGYVLQVDGHDFDLDRFHALLDQARESGAAVAAERLREALALWRGPALADFSFEAFAQEEIARLEELRLATLEERLEADLSLGRHAEVVGELEGLVGRHPLRERLRAQLMLALYRSGRQAEALDAYHDARRALTEELGIDPSRALQELERRILRQDPSLDLPPEPAARDARAGRRAAGPFVGRRSELELLLAGLEDALAGRGRLFLLSGEPGIGKSRLADEIASHAKERGARVLWGRCWEAGGAPAYWPWIQALRTHVRGSDPETLRDEVGEHAADLAQILPELRQLFGNLPEPRPLDPEAARFRLFDATSSLLDRAADTHPLVVVLDDLHAADESSLLLLRFLASELPVTRVLVIGTYREVDPVPSGVVSETLADVLRGSAQRLRLRGLDRAEVAELVREVTDADPSERLVSFLHTETEGNPLFVSEFLRLLGSEGALAAEGETVVKVPDTIREVIGRRLRTLSQPARQMLTLAAVIGRDFDLRVLETAAGGEADALLDPIDEAFAARVIADSPDGEHLMRFAHALLRDAFYEDLSPARRAEAHRRVGDALEAVFGANLEPHLAELAHHYFAAGPRGDPAKTIEFNRRAGDQALAALAYEEATRLYERALRALERVGSRDAQATSGLLLSLADAHARAGDSSRAKENALRAAELAQSARLPELLARAALTYGGRVVIVAAYEDRVLVELLEDALEQLGPEESVLRARLLARLATALRHEPDPARREAASREALEIARRLDDSSTLAYALDGRAGAIWSPDRLEERLGVAEELIDIAGRIGDKERAFQGRGHRAYALLELGEIDAANHELDSRVRLAEELGQPAQLFLARANRGLRALFEGRFEDAEDAIVEAARAGEHVNPRESEVSLRLQLFCLRREQGRLAELVSLLEESVPTYPVEFLLLCTYCELERTADARRLLDELAPKDFERLPWDTQWLAARCLTGEACASLQDLERAEVLYRIMSPFASLNAVSAPDLSIGSAGRYVGLLAHVLAREDEAEAHLTAALELNERMGARPWVAHTQHDLARLLLARGDTPRARELLNRSAETCRELGMTALRRRVAALQDVA